MCAVLANTNAPITLLPVRLETRFKRSQDQYELLIRVYPDVVHIDQHEPALTDLETKLGRAYWRSIRKAGDDPGHMAGAWPQLVFHLGAERAAWVARSTRPKATGTARMSSGGEQEFQETEQKEQSWSAPAYVRLLPTKWRAVGYVDAHTTRYAEGSPIRKPLLYSFDPLQPGDELKWLTDYNEAKNCGMAFSMILDSEIAKKGLERLLVYGIIEGQDPIDGANGLADLFEAHYYTHGLNFIEPGTPTNNTENVATPYNSDNPDYIEAYRVGVTDAVNSTEDSAGQRLSRALGFQQRPVQNAPERQGALMLAMLAGSREEAYAKNLSQCLWGATLGYYLSYMLAEDLNAGPDSVSLKLAARTVPDKDRVLKYAGARHYWRRLNSVGGKEENDLQAGELAASYDSSPIRAAKLHSVRYVRPGGAFYPLRIGNQPYGILPVTSIGAWAPFEKDEWLAALARAVARLRDAIWEPASQRSPRLGVNDRRDPDVVENDLIGIMASGPINQNLMVEAALDSETYYNIKRYADEDVVDAVAPGIVDDTVLPHQQKALDAAGIDWPPKAASVHPATPGFILPGDVAGKPGEMKKAFEWFAYWLYKEDDPKGFIYKLGQEEGYHPYTAGVALPLLFKFMRHSFLQDYLDAGVARRRRMGVLLQDAEYRKRILSNFQHTPVNYGSVWQMRSPGPLSIKKYLSDPTGGGVEELIVLREFTEAARQLASEPETALTPARLERLFRQTLDAASHRLDAWITSFAARNLDDIRNARVNGSLIGAYGWVEDLRPISGEGSQDGYIHAPSLNQALTAGVLRSAYFSRMDDSANPCAIQLPSWRVRTAQWLLSGLRNGQTLSGLGGYIFERALHEAKADDFIKDFRDVAGLNLTVVNVADNAEPYKTQTVDGVALVEKWRNNGLSKNLLNNKTEKALQELADALDSVADCLLAESIYSTLNGGYARASVILDMMAAGEGNIPELEFLRTSRSGNNITHRLILLADKESNQINILSGTGRPRAILSPDLNKLTAGILPSFEKVRLAVSFTNEEDKSVSIEVTLDQCDLCALDYVYESKHGCDEAPPVIASAMIEAARALLAANPGAINVQGSGAELSAHLVCGRGGDWPPADLTLPEFLSICDSLRQILSKARPLKPDDLTAGYEELEEPGPDKDLERRAQIAENLLLALEKKPSLPGAAALGINDAAHALLSGNETLAEAAALEIRKRLAKLKHYKEGPLEDPDQNNTEIIKSVLGDDFIVSATFTSGQAGDGGFAVLNGNVAEPAAIRRWISAVSKVRPMVSTLQRFLTLGAAFRMNGFGKARAAQFPEREDGCWIGQSVAGGCLDRPYYNFIFWGGHEAKPGDVISGLILDEWNETLPDANQMTGLAFYCETPATEPPQAILIAVPPGPNELVWTTEMLEKILLETLDLAKIRTVSRRELETCVGSRLVPAIYIAEGAADEIASTRLVERE